MRSKDLRRIGAASCIGIMLALVPAEAQTKGVAGRDSLPPVAQWDSLFARHDYFSLFDGVRAWSGKPAVEVRYYRGLLAHAWNRPDEAITLLQPLVDSFPRALAASHRLAAHVALAESYMHISRYHEAAGIFHRASRTLGNALDSTARSGLATSAAIADALSDALPQRVAWSRVSQNDTIPNAAQRARVMVRVNGSAVPAPLQVSIGAEFSLIDSSTAAAHRVRILPGIVDAVSLSGNKTTARTGLVSRLDIGAASVFNVAVLVFNDSDLTTSDRSSHVTGIIGFPVLNALGRIALTRDGHVALSSPGQPPLDTTRRARMVFDQASRRPLTPIVESYYAGRRVSFTLTLTAAPTVFFPAFGALLPAPEQKDSSVSGGPTERGATHPADITVAVGGHTVSFAEFRAPDIPNPEEAFHAGSFGADALRQADAVTLDFVNMTAGFDQLPPPPVLPTISYPEAVSAPAATHNGPRELVFIGLLFALFIVPKALQRFRIPGAITSLLMGAAGTSVGDFSADPTLHLLSTLGIVALFLFAGLEIDGRELRANASALLYHAAIWAALAIATAFIAAVAFGATPRVSALLALALVTPSTGFILSSLTGFGLSAAEQRTVKTYAVGSELLALGALFFVLQSTSAERLALAIAAMVGVVVFIPLAFRFFAAVVAPYAPRSEFAFLLMVAVVCAYTTLRLGVYYLVGAFLVGVAAQRFRADHPAMSSEKMVDALESFGSVFIPFYFFFAGAQISRDQLTPTAFAIGLLLAVVFVPLRIAVTGFHRKMALRESFKSARRIGSALVPTLVFTLVIVGILHDRFDLSSDIAGGLVLYTILNTMLPGFVLRGAPADFEDVAAIHVAGRRESEA